MQFKRHILLIIFLFDIALSGFLAFAALKSVKHKVKVVERPPFEKTEKLPEKSLDQTYNFLLLGYGGAGHDGGNLSDVIWLANLNPKTKKVTFISIPRDLWVDIPIRSDIKQSFKINAAYAVGTDDKKYGLKEPQYQGQMGGGTMAKKVVSDVTGLTIQNFVGIDFESYKRLVDTLGGIEVEVPVTFNDYSYPVKGLENATCNFSPTKIAELHQKYSGYELERQFTCRYEHLHFDKGSQILNGERALKFVRSRHSAEDGGDFARSRRQQAVLIGMKNKILSIKALKNIDQIYEEYKGLVTTDLDLASLKNFYQVVNPPEDYEVKFVSLTVDNVLVATKSLDGQFILIPKEGERMWVNVQRYIFDQVN